MHTTTLSISGLHLLSGLFPRNKVSYDLIRLHSEKIRNVENFKSDLPFSICSSDLIKCIYYF